MSKKRFIKFGGLLLLPIVAGKLFHCHGRKMAHGPHGKPRFQHWPPHHGPKPPWQRFHGPKPSWFQEWSKWWEEETEEGETPPEPWEKNWSQAHGPVPPWCRDWVKSAKRKAKQARPDETTDDTEEFI
jgi:hypothetical protein